MAASPPPARRKRHPLLCHKFVVREDKPDRVRPSVYAHQMSLSSDERIESSEVQPPRILELLDINKTSHHKLSAVDMDQALFQPFPSQLLFQNFTPWQTYSTRLLLFNKDKVIRQVKLEDQDSELFRITGPQKVGTKVSPGMSAEFTVSFTPQESKDYHHKLVFVTERERFEVPIHATGPRAVLDFGDEVHLPVCPVKASTEKTHLIRNTGDRTAKFTLHTQMPFSVTPSCGTLDVGKSVQVTVEFNPMTVGEHSQDLRLHYDTGEDVFISLYGACKELDVHLQHDSVMLKKTYLSLSTVRTVFFTNTSDIPLRYCWTTWPNLQEEALSVLRESLVLEPEEKEEKDQLLSQFESNPTAIHRLPLLSRFLQERRSHALQDNQLVLSDSCITVEPAEGEIWPKVTTQFTLVFKPKEAKLYQETIYCDVTGRESRLPLTITGEGLGPNLQLSYNLMNMGDVFIGDKDIYEVQLVNKGLIDAPFRLTSPDTTFGRCFSLSPEEGVVPSGACQIVEVTFHCPILGTFSEDLLITVTGQPEPPTLTFRGRVTGPTFNFNVSDLSFGDVAFGFPKTLTFSITNTSYVPMTFGLRVLGDGLGSPSVPWDKQSSDMSRNSWRVSVATDVNKRPAEFTVSPAAGSVPSSSRITIEVTLCANTVKTYRLALVVDVAGVGEMIRTLPINARCVVPDLVVDTPMLDFQRCFLDRPYEQKVRLINDSNLHACYNVLDQKYGESLSLHCSSSIPRGVIHPHSSVEIPVFLQAKAVGKLYHTLCIAVVGSLKPPLEVVLSCIGQGPIVHVLNPQLNFGKIPVLTDITRTLHLSNQSPVPAHFTTRMNQKKSGWRVEPSEGEVPPESQLKLRVVANLKDTLPFEDKLEVSIQHSQTHTVALSAIGTGTTIVSDRPFAPSIDLGRYFSHESCQYHFTLTNRGQRTHLLYWRTAADCLPSTQTRKKGNFSGRTVLPPISSARQNHIPGHGSELSSRRKKSVFSLSPSRVELFPGCSADMVLTGSSVTPKVVRERLMCHAIIGHQGAFEHIMSVDVTCHFVAPVLSISTKQLNFYIEKVLTKSLMPQYEKLILTNSSCLSLPVELAVEEPFTLCEAPGAPSSVTTKSMIVSGCSQAESWVCFDPDDCLDCVSRVTDKLLEIQHQGQPQKDMVKLHAEVHFPNLLFSSTTVDFGCVLNYTDTTRQIWITNCSPLPVSYHWTFLDDQKHRTMRATEMLEPLSPGPGADEESSEQSTEHAFQILPNSGHLQPGDKQEVILHFYGHQNIHREVEAQCHVEGGPTYKVEVRGGSSVVSYSLDSTHVDFGLLLFDQEGEAHVILRNTGKMGFEFNILDPQRNIQGVRPGRPVVIPPVGYIKAGAEQCLCVLYLPGVPEVFQKEIQLQVAHLPPQDITLTGEAVFSRISLNLPRNLSEECYSDVVQRARAAVEADRDRQLRDGITTEGGTTTEAACTLTFEEQLHMEIERTLVKENGLAVTSSLLKLRDSQYSSKKWEKLSKVLLPEYVLDFGCVVPGTVLSHTVNVTNTGPVDVSFHADHKVLTGTGFCAEFKRVKNLPCGETRTFTVQFDPKGANLKMGNTSVVMPIQVTGGAVVQVRLCAAVTELALTVSTDRLRFGTVQCGMCQMKTIRLFNCQSVPCSWTIAEEVKPFKKVDKLPPPKQRKKILQQQRPPPVVFTMIPSSGMLSPGERVDVKIKFSPAEGNAYSRRLVVHVAESTQNVFISAKGRGEEPQLEFCLSVLELGPCLPYSTEVEAEVTVKNPCPFPIEFYSLELDSQYLEEEKILRLMQGYDENNKLLLPPRVPGESLPKELLDFYEEYCSPLTDDAELNTDVSEKEAVTGDTHEKEKSKEEEKRKKHKSVNPVDLFVSETTKEESSARLEQLEMTPVCRAIARYMCEGLASRTHKGIAIIVYGAPLTDKNSPAAALACHYGGACLSVDAVLTDVLINGTSPVSQTLRHLYDCAVAHYAEREAAQSVEENTEPQPAADLEASAPVLHDVVEVLAKYCKEGDVTTLRNLLPEDLLVDMLVERFQLSDCHRGVVICGLESLYTHSPASTLQAVLKALSNRKHIYVVNLSDSYTALKARERAQREAEEALQKEKADRDERWLQELDDEEYDALPEEQKERIVQQHREKLRQKKLRELERVEKEQEEKRCQQEMVKRLREQELKKIKNGEKEDTKKGSKTKSSPEGKHSTHAFNGQKISPHDTSKDEHRKEHKLNEVHHGKQVDEETTSLHAESASPHDELEGENSSVDELQSQFSVYEHNQEKVVHILQHWDRARGLLLVPLPREEDPLLSKDHSKEKHTPVGRKSEKAISKNTSPMPNQVEPPAEAADKLSPEDIIPHIVLNVTGKDCPSATELLKGSSLPPLDEVLDYLGLGPSGPPIPPPATFSIVPFPKKRQQSESELSCDCFTFLDPTRPEKQGEEKKETKKASQTSAVKGRRSARRYQTPQEKHRETLELKCNQSLTKFRWVVPANGEVVLKIWFYSDSPAQFEQTFNFELVGTQRQYQLLCRGICTDPSTCEDNKV